MEGDEVLIDRRPTWCSLVLICGWLWILDAFSSSVSADTLQGISRACIFAISCLVLALLSITDVYPRLLACSLIAPLESLDVVDQSYAYTLLGQLKSVSGARLSPLGRSRNLNFGSQQLEPRERECGV